MTKRSKLVTYLMTDYIFFKMYFYIDMKKNVSSFIFNCAKNYARIEKKHLIFNALEIL